MGRRVRDGSAENEDRPPAMATPHHRGGVGDRWGDRPLCRRREVGGTSHGEMSGLAKEYRGHPGASGLLVTPDRVTLLTGLLFLCQGCAGASTDAKPACVDRVVEASATEERKGACDREHGKGVRDHAPRMTRSIRTRKALGSSPPRGIELQLTGCSGNRRADSGYRRRTPPRPQSRGRSRRRNRLARCAPYRTRYNPRRSTRSHFLGGREPLRAHRSWDNSRRGRSRSGVAPRCHRHSSNPPCRAASCRLPTGTCVRRRRRVPPTPIRPLSGGVCSGRGSTRELRPTKRSSWGGYHVPLHRSCIPEGARVRACLCRADGDRRCRCPSSRRPRTRSS